MGCNATLSGAPWWLTPVSTLLGVAVGASIPLFSATHRRRLERRGEVIAMISESLQARSSITSLTLQNIQAPLYRLPTTIFKQALPKLIGDGHLRPTEIDVLVEFLNRIDELNRGLERAGDAHSKHPEGSNWLNQEHSRNVAKAKEIGELPSERFAGLALIDGADMCLHRMHDLYSNNWLKHLLRSRQ